MPLSQQKLKPLKGFSLLEITIALVILGLLSFSLVDNIKVGRDFDDYNENRALLQEAKTALLAFVRSNGYLPCPDGSSTIDGLEDRTNDICDYEEGRLPFQTIGMLERDAYDNYFYYAVPTNADNATAAADPTSIASYFNSNSAPVFTLDTDPVNTVSVSGSLKVCGENATSCSSSTANADMVELAGVAVVMSFGKNGAHTWANLNSSTNLNAKELINADEDNYFWKDVGSYAASGVNAFDDQLIWLTGFDIKYAMLISADGLAE